MTEHDCYCDRTAGRVSASAVLLAALIAAASIGSASAQTVLKKEPPRGGLKLGQVVLVDDGSCPAGQIKEVRGGKGAGQGSVKRVRRCVARK